MRILIYGENWPGTMADLLKSSLESRGHEVAVTDFTRELWRAKYSGILGKVLDRTLWNQAVNRINEKFLTDFSLFKPHAVLVSKGVHIKPETLRKMKDKGAILTNWNPDDFLNPLNSSKHLLRAMKEYDIIFSPRPHLFDEYRSFGTKACIVLHWYYDPVYHRKVQLPSEWEGIDCRSDISFVGSYSPYREERLWALKGSNVKVWGAHWNKASSDFKRHFYVTGKVIPSIELPRIIMNSKINLNILTRENRDKTNLKLFEIPACGGLMLSERTPESEQILKPGEEAFYFSDNNELASTCKTLLTDNSLRMTVAEAGYERITKGKNTLNDRAGELLTILESYVN